jgi:methyl-accepting chemotaxis protein
MLGEQTVAVKEISNSVASIAELSDRNKQHADEAIHAVRKTETTVEERFAELDKQTIDDSVLYRAKSDHYLWKKRLAEMLVGLNSLKVQELADHHSCRLGKWYDQVDDAWFKNNPMFKDLLGPHEKVHTLGKQAAEAHQSGQAEEAWQLYKQMDEASLEVVRLLDKLIEARANAHR